MRLALTDGQQADCPQLTALLADLPQLPGKVVADKVYDTNQVLAAIARHQAEAVIPPKANRVALRLYDENLYADHTKVECFFGRLKEARGFATRYEKTATSFLEIAHLLVALNWLR